MTWYALSHLADGDIARELPAKFARVSRNDAEALAWLAEFDARRLYLPAAHPSMHSYCVHEMHMEPDPAFKLIRVARTAWKFPAIFPELAAQHLNHSAVILLAPSLTPNNVTELLAAAKHKTNVEIEQLQARQCPRPGVGNRELGISADTDQQAVRPVKLTSEQQAAGQPSLESGNGVFEQQAPRPVETSAPRRQPNSHELRHVIGESNFDKLQYAKSLASHRATGRDVEDLLGQALDLLIREFERRKFGATKRPRKERSNCSSAKPRYVPRHVKRAVWQRDHGQCTFTSETGTRCPSRSLLEFDHIDPVARGGEATVAGMRLRCRAHNQYTAECEFGLDFMKRKRELARETAARARAQAAEARAAAEEEKRRASAAAKEAAMNPERDVTPWLRRLGFRADEVKRAAVHCETIAGASLEERVRVGLAFLTSNPASRPRSSPYLSTRTPPRPCVSTPPSAGRR